MYARWGKEDPVHRPVRHVDIKALAWFYFGNIDAGGSVSSRVRLALESKPFIGTLYIVIYIWSSWSGEMAERLDLIEAGTVQ